MIVILRQFLENRLRNKCLLYLTSHPLSHSLYSRVSAVLGFHASNICHITIYHQQPSPHLLLLLIVLPLTLATLAFFFLLANSLFVFIFSSFFHFFSSFSFSLLEKTQIHHLSKPNRINYSSSNFPLSHDTHSIHLT